MAANERRIERRIDSSSSSDPDDVSVFVSPKKFGGHTPGARAARQRIFDEERQAAENAERERHQQQNQVPDTPPQPQFSDDEDRVAIDVDKIKYTLDQIEEGRHDDATHKNIRRNNILGMALLAINYALVALGFLLLIVSVWISFGHRNPGIAAYISVRGFMLKAPLALGAGLFVAAGASIFNGFFLGAAHVAPSVVEGLRLRERRVAYTWHQVLSTLTIALFTIVLVSSYPLLNQLDDKTAGLGVGGTDSANATRGGAVSIGADVWHLMAHHHPDRVCKYEVRNSCSGAPSGACTAASAVGNTECPGSFCAGVCKLDGMNASQRPEACKACKAFSSQTLLMDCKSMESRPETAQNCRQILRRDLRSYLVVLVVSSGLGVGWMVVVTLMSFVSPILTLV